MSKATTPKVPTADLSKFCKSSFTLTFVVEVTGIDIWHDCNEGWLDLGPIAQGVKIQYQLYPGQNFDVDVLIWPHTAKVFCGTNYGWVRTWQFLERRWVTFSIRHAFAVRVVDLRNFVATVVTNNGIGSLSANAKNDKNGEVYLPRLVFGERRQFASVQESEIPLPMHIKELIWDRVVHYIPTSYMDGLFDTPYPVSDIRHQDAVLNSVHHAILNRTMKQDIDLENEQLLKAKQESKMGKEKDKKKVVEVQKVKFETKLSGDSILAGIGRITPFETIGDRPTDQGEVIVLISSTNLPAHDDLPVVFVNIGSLTDIPVEIFQKHRITHIYTRWTLSEEEHNSEHQPLFIKQARTDINLNDHHAIPLSCNLASDTMATFLDEPFEIELRGIRILPITKTAKFFGYEKSDRDFGTAVPPKLSNQDTDILIAQTKIDASKLSKMNTFIKEDFQLYPPTQSIVSLEREAICTNDINGIRARIKPELEIQSGDILEAQMTLEVSMGLVGCKPTKVPQRFSRLYCLISDPEAIMMILRQITEINETVLLNGCRDDLLTGFGLDTGDTVMLYVEGPRDGEILRVWEMTDDFYPKVKPVFSTSAKYHSRLYPELLLAAIPFNILKMFVPLAVVLSLTPIYARPALPLPTRFAVLKIGRLVASKLTTAPTRKAMPTAMELKSFRLELCVAPRPAPNTILESPLSKIVYDQGVIVPSTSRINWEKKE